MDPGRRDPGLILLRAGRPVLVVPDIIAPLALRRVIVAWKDTRECRRAVRDALPLLQQAKEVLLLEVEDAVCRRLMSVPGVGPVVAVTFKSAVDDPSRIAKSKAVGALFGLTPKKYQSGEKMSPAESREPAMRWCARHSMKLPMFCRRG